MEVSVGGDGSYRIERCVCAVDVGRPINRLGLEAQMMGGTIDGQLGDHVLIAPPFIATAGDIDAIVERLGDAVDAAIEGGQAV